MAGRPNDHARGTLKRIRKPKASSKKLGETLKTIIKTTDKPLRLFFQDEGRFGRISQLRRCWGLKGKRATVPAQHIRQYTYTFAALEPLTGETVSLILPSVNGVTMSIFLGELSQSYPDNHLAVVLDGAGWHKCKELVVPDNITLVFLPPYSPELNPVEQLWKTMRGKWFANKLFESIYGCLRKQSGRCFTLGKQCPGSHPFFRALFLDPVRYS